MGAKRNEEGKKIRNNEEKENYWWSIGTERVKNKRKELLWRKFLKRTNLF